MMYRLVLLTALVGLALGLSNGAEGGEPTDQIRADIEELYRTVQGSASQSGGDREAAILDRMFDWSRMSESALRGHWQQLSPAQRDEFTKLFAAVFRRAYVSRIHVIDASKFQYHGDTVDGSRATVKTTVFTNKGSALNVDYAALHESGGRWRIDDVRVDRISLVENYRTQFSSFIARSSYESLVKKLRDSAK